MPNPAAEPLRLGRALDAMPSTISRPSLARSIAAGAVVVIEALGADYYSAGHIPTAINVPLSSPDELLERVVASAELPLVVYGAGSSGEAMELARRLEQLCDRPVLVYAGGKEDWVEAGLPLEESETSVATDSPGL